MTAIKSLAASMWPRPISRGKFDFGPGLRRDRRASMWPRPISRGKIGVHPFRLTAWTVGDASMWPRPISRGKAHASHHRHDDASGHCTLQCGRGRSAAESCNGPGSGNRSTPTVTSLQCGRGRSATAESMGRPQRHPSSVMASMWPRFDQPRKKSKPSVRRQRKRSSFNVAAADQPRESRRAKSVAAQANITAELQCGRGRSAAEDTAWPSRAVSRRLQCGRGRSAAERHTTRGRSTSTAGFNVAAADQPRKAICWPAAAPRRLSASMWPRPISRGKLGIDRLGFFGLRRLQCGRGRSNNT